MNDGLGKQAEQKIKEWLDKPEYGYCFDRIPDQMTGHFMVSRNICDFICYHHPDMFYIESKATWEDRWAFSSLSETQHDGLLAKSKILGVKALVIVLFASHKRAFIFHIEDIKKAEDAGVKSLNITKIDKWPIEYREITTIPSNKKLLDYAGTLDQYTAYKDMRRGE